MKKKHCEECGERKPLPFYSDPRSPPIEEGPCLCEDCYEVTLIEVIDENEGSLKSYKEDLFTIQNKNAEIAAKADGWKLERGNTYKKGKGPTAQRISAVNWLDLCQCERIRVR